MKKKRKQKGKNVPESKKLQPDLVYEFGKLCVGLSNGKGSLQRDSKVSIKLEDVNIDFNMDLFKAILKGAILDKDTDKIIIQLPKVNSKKLFEHYIKRRVASLQAEIERSESLDELVNVAERVKAAKLTLTEEAIDLFASEKSRLLWMIEEKFGGAVKLGEA